MSRREKYDPQRDAHDSYYAAIEAKRIRAVLQAYGFSAFKAAEIALDASRGDEYARQFIKLAEDSAA